MGRRKCGSEISKSPPEPLQLRGSTEEIRMDLGLRGRNAVVLGGTRGIGRAIAGTLAGEGAGVAVCARNVDQVMNALLPSCKPWACGQPVHPLISLMVPR